MPDKGNMEKGKEKSNPKAQTPDTAAASIPITQETALSSRNSSVSVGSMGRKRRRWMRECGIRNEERRIDNRRKATERKRHHHGTIDDEWYSEGEVVFNSDERSQLHR
ncbi:hypothetical protein VTN00DRAFT_5668 [Thermoascus crustaceus]|uniref:uncharacterized protein n=1 Tax=Thermoascus crustaceus TaxID=5088 RepID=UPI00374232F8